MIYVFKPNLSSCLMMIYYFFQKLLKVLSVFKKYSFRRLPAFQPL